MPFRKKFISRLWNWSQAYYPTLPDEQERNHRRSPLLTICEGNRPFEGWYPAQRASNAESVPFYDDIILIMVKINQIHSWNGIVY